MTSYGDARCRLIARPGVLGMLSEATGNATATTTIGARPLRGLRTARGATTDCGDGAVNNKSWSYNHLSQRLLGSRRLGCRHSAFAEQGPFHGRSEDRCLGDSDSGAIWG